MDKKGGGDRQMDGTSRRQLRSAVGACLRPVFSISVPLKQLLGQNPSVSPSSPLSSS